MMQLCPIGVPGYLIPFIKNEMNGITIVKDTTDFTSIRVEPKSVLGMFLTRRIRPSYKVKFYNLTIYSTKIGKKRAFSSEILEIQSSAEFRVDLSFEDLDAFYKFIDCSFRMSFYFYVKGYCIGSHSDKKIREAIRKFCDEYDLLEYGYSENQMRRAFYQYRNKGGIYKIHKHERLSDFFFGEK